MPRCSICEKKQLIMDRCIRCNVPICSDHSIQVANNLEPVIKGSAPYFDVNYAYFCRPCLGHWGAEISERRKTAWITSYGIDFCPPCGEGVKLSFRISLPSYPLLVNDVIRSTRPTNVPFVQRDVRCDKCGRVYAMEPILLNMPNKDFKGTGKLFIPRSDTIVNMTMYNEYVNGMKAERAGRYLDSAAHFERAGFLERAKSLRDASRVVRHEHKHITFDVNRMIEALDRTGYTIPYKCPSCGATVKLNKERGADRFLICEYCNASLRAVDIEDLIKQVL